MRGPAAGWPNGILQRGMAAQNGRPVWRLKGSPKETLSFDGGKWQLCGSGFCDYETASDDAIGRLPPKDGWYGVEGCGYDRGSPPTLHYSWEAPTMPNGQGHQVLRHRLDGRAVDVESCNFYDGAKVSCWAHNSDCRSVSCKFLSPKLAMAMATAAEPQEDEDEDDGGECNGAMHS